MILLEFDTSVKFNLGIIIRIRERVTIFLNIYIVRLYLDVSVQLNTRFFQCRDERKL